MRKLVMVAALLLAGCSDPGKDAERQFRLVERGGSKADLCKAAEKVEQAYLAAENVEQHRRWRGMRHLYCTEAQWELEDR